MSQDPAGDPAVPWPEPARRPPPPSSPAGTGVGPSAGPGGWAAPAYAPIGGGSSPASAAWVGPGAAAAPSAEPWTRQPGPAAGAVAGPWISPGGVSEQGAPVPVVGSGLRGTAATASDDASPAGGIPLRPLGVGDILDGTFSTIRRNPKATIGLAAVLVTIQQVLVVGLTLLTQGLPTSADLGADDEIDIGLLSQQLIGGLGGLVGTLLSAVVGAVLTGMLVVVVSEDVLGRRVTIGQVWARVRPRIWALLVAATIAGIVPYVALLPLALPGMILWAAWAVTTPAVVLERLGPFQALRRSWRLVWPAVALVWLIRALSVVISWVVELILALPFGVAGGLLASVVDEEQVAVVTVAAQALGAIAADTISLPFLAGVLALIYLDRRIRGEGLDLVLRRQRRLSGSAPAELPAVPTSPGGTR